ncbi:hypothetical protein HSX10_03665 [Winogradskyella undariae]|uniref:DUF2586 family protein n=1 Tax=Winogradskyella undariae TaxID=1285465 RepID=UPI00156A8331|nr:DUF2586 family protein [Winogradskyella undariae]NRR90657.1 hypothetical protein [Winogradskyella undariae]
MLPGINIEFDNGNLDTVVSTADGVFGLLASAVAVVDKFELNKAYQIKNMADVANLGILPDVNNYVLYRWLEKFYEEAGEGTKLWIMGRAKTEVVSFWFTPDVATGVTPAKKLYDASNGEISISFTAYAGTTEVVIENGMDADVPLAKSKSQTFNDLYTTENFAPVFTILEAYAFTGEHDDLLTLLEGSDNRVGIFVGNTEKRTGDVTINGCSTSVLAGRLARIGVHENAGKRLTGSLATLTAYIVDLPVEEFDVEALHDKGFITFRTHIRKSGYWISDDPLATDPANDDYSHITRRRVIDKALRVAHNIAGEQILNDFDVTNEGKVDPIYAKNVEGDIEREIAAQMDGEISRDSTNRDDFGVVAEFDKNAVVSATSRTNIKIRVRPKTMNRFIEINLGYAVNLENV